MLDFTQKNLLLKPGVYIYFIKIKISWPKTDYVIIEKFLKIFPALNFTVNVGWETLSCLTILNFQKSSILACNTKLAI